MSDVLLPLQCPECGGQVQYTTGDVDCTCPYCGTKFLIKDALKAKSIDRLASAIEEASKPDMLTRETELALVNFAKAWNSGYGNYANALMWLQRALSLNRDERILHIQEQMEHIDTVNLSVNRSFRRWSMLKSWVLKIALILGIVAGIFLILLENKALFYATIPIFLLWVFIAAVTYISWRKSYKEQRKLNKVCEDITKTIADLLQDFSS